MKRAFAVILATASVVGCRHHGTPTTTGGITPPPPTQSLATQPAVQTPINPPIVIPPAKTQTPPETPRTIAPIPLPPPPLATVDGIQIPRDRVASLLMQSYGLNMLRRVVQVEMSRQEAAKEGLTVSADDIAKEHTITLNTMFADNNQKLLEQIADADAAGRTDELKELREKLQQDNSALLKQLLTQQQLTREMFDLQMEANAYLRKVVEKRIQGKITEDMERQAFNTIYGENVRVRHIQCANIAEISEVQRRLAAGQPFEAVARDLSRNGTTRGLGGEFPPFSRETPHIPQQFKDVAFSLKPGEVSDPVETNGTYHLIKLLERIPPKAVKFEDLRASVHERLFDRWVTEEMKALRDRLGQKAVDSLQINDPVLAKQFKDLLTKRDNEIKDRDQIARELVREREAQARDVAAQTAATQPTTAPAPTSQPVTAASPAGNLRPPATKSGFDTPDPKPQTSPSTQP